MENLKHNYMVAMKQKEAFLKDAETAEGMRKLNLLRAAGQWRKETDRIEGLVKKQGMNVLEFVKSIY